MFCIKDMPAAFSPMGGPRCQYKKKKKSKDLRKLENIRKVFKLHRMIA